MVVLSLQGAYLIRVGGALAHEVALADDDVLAVVDALVVAAAVVEDLAVVEAGERLRVAAHRLVVVAARCHMVHCGQVWIGGTLKAAC